MSLGSPGSRSRNQSLRCSEPDPPSAIATTPRLRDTKLPSPKAPSSLRPHVQSVPSSRTASLCEPPDTLVIRLSPGTAAGISRSLVLPSPSSPDAFDPQVHTVPSRFTAAVGEIAATFDNPTTGTGRDLSTVVPSPSWPLSFAPHATTDESARRATTWEAAAFT